MDRCQGGGKSWRSSANATSAWLQREEKSWKRSRIVMGGCRKIRKKMEEDGFTEWEDGFVWRWEGAGRRDLCGRGETLSRECAD